MISSYRCRWPLFCRFVHFEMDSAYNCNYQAMVNCPLCQYRFGLMTNLVDGAYVRCCALWCRHCMQIGSVNDSEMKDDYDLDSLDDVFDCFVRCSLHEDFVHLSRTPEDHCCFGRVLLNSSDCRSPYSSSPLMILVIMNHIVSFQKLNNFSVRKAYLLS